jgi:hypothetical protein
MDDFLVSSSGGELPRLSGNNRMALDVMGVTQVAVAVIERSDFGLQDARSSIGCGLRRACEAFA